MKNYKMTIQYDGTRYSGWQKQVNTDRSIQAKIEAVLSKMVGHGVEINGSGRTDAGVHALGQVASFKIQSEKSTDEIQNYINNYLPEDVAVTSLTEVDDRFHARLCVKRKTYLYRVNNSNISPVFERKYVYTFPERLDIEKMRQAAQKLLGEHDFVGFSSLKKVKKSTVRTIYDVRIIKGENQSEIDIYITGNGFLYNMVRIITGTLLEIGMGKKDIGSIDRILNAQNREDAGFTAPSCGLTLYSVEY